jgi:hypothetical protein
MSTSNVVAEDNAQALNNVDTIPLVDQLAELTYILDDLEIKMEDGLVTLEEYAEACRKWYVCFMSVEDLAATE